jgi:pullulanase/glycogen debranching enzyme
MRTIVPELRRRRSDERSGVNELRNRQMRNMLARCCCAGTPILLAGDEFARTQ